MGFCQNCSKYFKKPLKKPARFFRIPKIRMRMLLFRPSHSSLEVPPPPLRHPPPCCSLPCSCCCCSGGSSSWGSPSSSSIASSSPFPVAGRASSAPVSNWLNSSANVAGARASSWGRRRSRRRLAGSHTDSKVSPPPAPPPPPPPPPFSLCGSSGLWPVINCSEKSNWSSVSYTLHKLFFLERKGLLVVWWGFHPEKKIHWERISLNYRYTWASGHASGRVG